MRRALALAPLLVGLAVAPVAQAKGPTSAAISGPGLDEPLSLAALAEAPHYERYWRIVEGLGFFPAAFGQPQRQLLAGRPAGDLGPKYTIRYVVPTRLGKPAIVIQELFPYAAGGPVTYMSPGQNFFERTTAGGWFRSASTVKQALVARGLPATAPSGGSGSGTRTIVIVGGALVLGVLGAAAVAALRRRPRPAHA